MSTYLQWMVVRNCYSFLIKRNKQTYSTEPNDLKAHNFLCYNWPIHRKMVGVELAVWCRREAEVWPVKDGNLLHADHHQQEQLDHLQQHQAHDRKNKYCPDLSMATILSSQKLVMVKRKQAHPTKSS